MTTVHAFIDEMRSRLSMPGPRPCRGRELLGLFVVIIMDKSGSMADGDYPPSRYLAGVRAIEHYITAREKVSYEDTLSAVLFSSRAELVCDGCCLAEADSKIIQPMRERSPSGGTDIKAGLVMAGRAIQKAGPAAQKRIILLSDGHGGRPFDYAKRLKGEGVVIDCIGIGGKPSDVDEVGLKGVASLNSKTEKPRYRFIGDGNIDELFAHFRKLATDIVRV